MTTKSLAEIMAEFNRARFARMTALQRRAAVAPAIAARKKQIAADPAKMRRQLAAARAARGKKK